jgi:hypothetical protein
VCIYAHDQLVASHVRSMQRHKDFELPEHAQQLVLQRMAGVNYPGRPATTILAGGGGGSF